ncbi:MAG: SRPBCC family protein [Rhizobiales bacterium]|nr:SRPBCC family protein [Hyphomicrobiales bacterium]NRB14412.1 SRPBCC family protein [Hyphomicrobiales bacterium]
MNYLLIGLGVFIAIIGLIFLVAALLPVNHMASRTILLKAPTDVVWHKLTDFANMAKWRRDIVRVSANKNVKGDEIWQEYENEKSFMAFKTLELIEAKKLVRQVVGENLLFGGRWTFDLVAQGNQTQLTITEHGEVYNLIFRFVGKFIIGHHATMDKYIEDLQQTLG